MSEQLHTALRLAPATTAEVLTAVAGHIDETTLSTGRRIRFLHADLVAALRFAIDRLPSDVRDMVLLDAAAFRTALELGGTADTA